uniref:Cycloidea-like protein n=1 Tax=Flaveria bidentis TaxID=4224 RepID=A0A346D3T3_FLABI|nr:cycloidea-like protein [Flaveria bidentis]
MFSSAPFQEFPLSPNLLIENEKDCVYLNYHQNSGDPFINDGGFFHSPVMEGSTFTIKQDFVGHRQHYAEGPVLESCEDHYDLLDAVVSCSKAKKKTVVYEKDGHGKIYTSRGFRERRVRLSIEISRKFFCLQELLGFDKASNTLDWLLTKSKKAIKELVDETNRGSSSTAFNDRSDADFLESIKGDSDEGKGNKKKLVIKCLDGEMKKMNRKSVGGFQENLASRDQLRAMARARARERTGEKMNTKKLNDS